MEEKYMSSNTKIEVALEIIDEKIGIAFHKEDKDEKEKLMKEREQLYLGNEEMIEKIIKVYGPEIKKLYESE